MCPHAACQSRGCCSAGVVAPSGGELFHILRSRCTIGRIRKQKFGHSGAQSNIFGAEFGAPLPTFLRVPSAWCRVRARVMISAGVSVRARRSLSRVPASRGSYQRHSRSVLSARSPVTAWSLASRAHYVGRRLPVGLGVPLSDASVFSSNPYPLSAGRRAGADRAG